MLPLRLVCVEYHLRRFWIPKVRYMNADPRCWSKVTKVSSRSTKFLTLFPDEYHTSMHSSTETHEPKTCTIFQFSEIKVLFVYLLSQHGVLQQADWRNRQGPRHTLSWDMWSAASRILLSGTWSKATTSVASPELSCSLYSILKSTHWSKPRPQEEPFLPASCEDSS